MPKKFTLYVIKYGNQFVYDIQHNEEYPHYILKEPNEDIPKICSTYQEAVELNQQTAGLFNKNGKSGKVVALVEV